MLAAILTLAATSTPVGLLDVGMVGGMGGANVPAEIDVLRSWFRVGPEVIGSVFLTPTLSVGIGLGYQAGYYGRNGTTVRRNEYSARLLFRYHFIDDTDFEHAIGFGLGARVSHVGPLPLGFRSYDQYQQDAHRLSGFVGYWPAYRLSERFRVTGEICVAFGPSLGDGNDFPLNAEATLRLGIEYRF